MKTINLVVGFTPYHALFSESFLADLKGETYCFFTKNYPNIPLGSKVKFFRCGKSPLFSYIFYALCLRFWFFKNYDIRLFCPHPCHFASNFPFFSGKCSSVTIYEDGVANYYDAVKPVWNLSLSKKIFSFITFLPFRDYSGHVTGCDERNVDACFVSRPSLIVGAKKFGQIVKKELKVISRSRSRKKSKILFLDQPTDLSDKEKHLLLKKVVTMLGDRVTVYYKPHHESSSKYEFMEALPVGYVDMAAEELVAISDYATVISFNSSALINIQEIYDDVSCYYIETVDKKIKVDGVHVSVYDFLAKNGVKSIFSSGLVNAS